MLSQPTLAAAALLSPLLAPAQVSLLLGLPPGKLWRNLGSLAQDRQRGPQIAGCFSEDAGVRICSDF